jgi:serine/threonine protein kinase
MGQLMHPNIIRLLGVCIEPGNLCLLMEFADLGTLRDIIELHPSLSGKNMFCIF